MPRIQSPWGLCGEAAEPTPCTLSRDAREEPGADAAVRLHAEPVTKPICHLAAQRGRACSPVWRPPSQPSARGRFSSALLRGALRPRPRRSCPFAELGWSPPSRHLLRVRSVHRALQQLWKPPARQLGGDRVCPVARASPRMRTGGPRPWVQAEI